MRDDPVARFVQLHRQLTNEKKHLEERLARINRALSSLGHARKGRSAGFPRTAARNSMSLREAIFRATSARPLTKPEIFDAVEALGYRFTGKDPMNAINVQLYTKGQFKRDGRKFSPGPALLKKVASLPRPDRRRGLRLKHRFRLP
jgi:hypothetical protein